MHFCGVAKVVEDGVIGDDGAKTVCDTIVCATGFGKGCTSSKQLDLLTLTVKTYPTGLHFHSLDWVVLTYVKSGKRFLQATLA